MTQPTEDDIIFDIAKADEQVEGNLTAREYDEIGDYNTDQARNRFGTWNEAKKTAGVRRTESGKTKSISKEELLEDLNQANEKVEGRLTQKKYQKHGNYSSGTIYDRFESMTEAKKQAGIEEETYDNKKKISDEKLLEELNNGLNFKEIAEKYGYSGTSTISQRVRKKNWNIRNKLNSAGKNNSAMILSIPKEEVIEAGLDPDKETVYYEAETTKQGTMTLELTTERVEQKD